MARRETEHAIFSRKMKAYMEKKTHGNVTKRRRRDHEHTRQ